MREGAKPGRGSVNGENAGKERRGGVQTGSSSVDQKERSMSVTTRPGEEGVPRWSCLICEEERVRLDAGHGQGRRRTMPVGAVKSQHKGCEDEESRWTMTLPARNAARNLIYGPEYVSLCGDYT